MRLLVPVLFGLAVLLTACGGAAAPSLGQAGPGLQGPHGTFAVEGVRFVTPNGERVVEVFVFVDGQRIGGCDVRRMRGEECVAHTPVTPGAHAIEIGVSCRKPDSLSTLGCAYTVLDRVHFDRRESVTLDLERAFENPEDSSGYLTRHTKTPSDGDARDAAPEALAHVTAPPSEESPSGSGTHDSSRSDRALR